MVEYSADGKTAVYCGYKFRKDGKTGYYLCNKKTDVGYRERLHVFVYRKEHGGIPVGMHIHHIDGNKDNNEPSNLVALTPSEHEKHHGANMSEERIEKSRQNLKEKAIPKASEWHRSENGREWHRKHGKEVAQNMKPKLFICEQCGKEYMSKPVAKHRFCSNNCRAAYRRKSGVDNIERKCENCGKTYFTNKYSQAKYCGKKCMYEVRKNKNCA